MAYITEQDYKEYTGADPPGDYSVLANRACDQIDILTMYRIAQRGMDMLPDWVQGQVRKACCAQMQYLDANGGIDALLGETSASETVGKYSYSSRAAADGGGSGYAPMVMQYLAPTGLLYCGMGVMD